jgi:hypothetical protein
LSPTGYYRAESILEDYWEAISHHITLICDRRHAADRPERATHSGACIVPDMLPG